MSVPNVAAPSSRSWGGFTVYAVAFVLLIASASAPSPLYPSYQAQWSLSPLVLTAVFAVYVGGLLVSLLTVGSLSDHIGRRPMVVTGLLLATASMVVLDLAPSAAVLIVGRIVQGLAVGIAMTALGAAVLDREPPARRGLAALLNGVIPPVGLAVGALLSGALVRLVPAPTHTVYEVVGALLLLSAVAVALTPESRVRRPGAWASLRPDVRIPVATRRTFTAVLGSMAASWVLVGLYLVFVPDVLSASFGIPSPLVSGAVIALLTGVGALTGFLIRGADAERAMRMGVVALLVGPTVSVAAVWLDSPLAFVASTVVAGIGFGAGFQAGLRLLLATAPAEERAGLLSSVYVVSYLAFGLPAVAAGAAEPLIGLNWTVTAYGALVLLAAITTLVLQRTMRRSRAAEDRADVRERELRR